MYIINSTSQVSTRDTNSTTPHSNTSLNSQTYIILTPQIQSPHRTPQNHPQLLTPALTTYPASPHSLPFHRIPLLPPRPDIYHPGSLRPSQHRILRRGRSHPALLGLLVHPPSRFPHRHLRSHASILDRARECPDP